MKPHALRCDREKLNTMISSDRIRGDDADSFQKVAELASADSVLLRDSRCAYLFDPHYVEVYMLTPSRGAVEVTKPVWFGEAVGPVRHAATVSATWKDGALSEPYVTMRRGFENSPKPTWEVGKMQRMIDALREAVSSLPDEPVPATTGEARPLRQRGEQ